MTAPNYVLDPWFSWHETPEQQDAAVSELTRRIIAGEVTAACTPAHEPYVDADTRIVGGRLSRWAARRMYRPQREGPWDERGVDRNGRYNPSADGGGW